MWKPVTGYEGIYEVNENSEIRTCEGKTTFTEKHGERKWKQRILKQKTDKLNYKRVTLYKDGKPKDFLVHRLVATAFCPKEEGKNIINHIDGDPSNNHYSNLQWCNHRENLIHAFINKMNPNPNAVILIHKETGTEYDFYSMGEASRFLGRNNGYISGLINRNKYETEEYVIVVVKR